MYNVFSTREIGVLKVVNLMLTARQMLIFKCIVEEFIENKKIYELSKEVERMIISRSEQL